MSSNYSHGIIPRLPFSNANITLIEGEGEFTQGGTLSLFLQGRNRAGYTVPSTAIALINYSATQAIQISFPASARTSATDFHNYVLSSSPTGNASDAVAIAQWTNYEEDQITTRTLAPIVLSRDAHIALATTISLPSNLPTGANLVDGMHRFVTSLNAYYRYQQFNETRPADGNLVLEPVIGEKWVKVGSPNVGVISSVYGTDGCAAPIATVNGVSLINLPPYAADGAKGTPLKLMWRNDSNFSLPRGTSFLLEVTLSGASASKLFNGKLLITPRGFVNLTTGALDTTDGIGGTMPDLGADLPYIYGDRTALYLHKNLPAGQAYLIEISAYFTAAQLSDGVLQGSTVAINLTPAPQAGENAFAIWKVMGDTVFSDNDKLQVVPDLGLGVKVLSGSALVKRFTFTPKNARSVGGITPNLSNQKITIDGNSSLFYRGTGAVPGTEALRALVSCQVGYSAASAYTAPISVAANGAINVTLNYPCDANGFGLIRSSYPYLAGVVKGRFNPPYVQLFVHRQSDGKVFQLPTRVTVLPGVSQSAIISNLAGATELVSLPSAIASDFCLFDPPGIAIATGGSGSLAFDTYKITASYYFDGLAISAINHNPASGCIAEIPGTIAQLYEVLYSWGPAVAESAIATISEDATHPWQTRRIYGNKRFAYFDPESLAENDGVVTWRPTWRTALQPGRWKLDERTAWFVTDGVPVSGLGVIGDLAIDTNPDSATAGNVYRKTSNTVWTLEGNLRGAPGLGTVTLGATTTLDPGVSATLTNTGTSEDVILNFGIPRGATGVAGAAGIQGAGATIGIGTVTTVAPSVPASVSNSGTPTNATLNFALPQGIKGDAAATVVVGTVTTTAPGGNATVVNTGTSSDVVLDFGIPRGTVGTVATIGIGTINTLSAGSSATVSNSGTASAAVLNFGIPQGGTGAVGAAGPQGGTGPTGSAATIAIGSTTTLAAGSNAAVANVGSSSAAILNFSIPQGAVGSPGATGNTGAQGSTGASGSAATVAIGTTTTLTPGSSATVANSGTTSAAVFDFAIPKGEPGEGETNTSSNVGTSGVGFALAKSGVNLPFKKLASATSLITVTDNTANSTVDLAIDNSTAAWNAISLRGYAIANAAPTNGQILKWVDATSLYTPADESSGTVNNGRLTATYTTAILLPGETENGLIELALSYEVLQAAINVAGRLRLYTTAAYLSSDALRDIDTDPTGENGVALEVITTGDNLSIDMTKNPPGSNLEAMPSNEIPIAITNLSASPAAVTVTITYLPTEF